MNFSFISSNFELMVYALGFHFRIAQYPRRYTTILNSKPLNDTHYCIPHRLELTHFLLA